MSGEQFQMPESLLRSFEELVEHYKSFIASCKVGEESFFNRRGDEGEFVFSEGNLYPFKGSYLVKDEDEVIEDPARCFKQEFLYDNLFLRNLALMTLKALPDYEESAPRYIDVMLSCHDYSCKALQPHHDGDQLEWVVLYNIHRSAEGIDGAEIQITDNNNQLLEQHPFNNPLDCYFLRNSLFQHGATAIEISKEGASRNVAILRVYKKDQAVSLHSKIK